MALRDTLSAIRKFFTLQPAYTSAPLESPTTEAKANPAGPLIVSSYGYSQPVRTPRRFDNLADAGFNQQPAIFRAITLISTACAGIPWVLYERKGSNRRGTEIDQHPLIDLMQKPNPNQGWGKFFEAYVAYLYIAGNSYIYANRAQNGKGAPVELWTLRPDRMRVVPDEKQFVRGFTYEVNGKHIDFDPTNCMHTKTFAPLDDWYGMSPLVVAARSVDILNAGGDWNLALVQNSGRVPGFFVSDERLADTQFSRMREQLLDRYTGTRNVGLPGLLEQGIKWEATGVTPLEMDWGGLTMHEQRNVALAIGVPSEMLADPEVKTYASYSEARAGFYTETVLPLMDILRDEMNRWLVPMFAPGLWLDYDTEEIEALAPLRASRWAQVNTANFLTIDEKREAVGYDPLPDGKGNVIVLLTSNATLDQVEHGQADGAMNGTGNKPVVGHVIDANPKPQGLPPPREASDADEGDPTPAPEGNQPGQSGVMDDSIGDAGIDVGEKAYDPLDDLLAGKVIRLKDYRPKAVAPMAPGSPSHRRIPTATNAS
jgi:HK97 family phage portal protein